MYGGGGAVQNLHSLKNVSFLFSFVVRWCEFKKKEEKDKKWNVNVFWTGFYCSGVSSYTEGAEGGSLDWAVNKVGGNDDDNDDSDGGGDSDDDDDDDDDGGDSQQGELGNLTRKYVDSMIKM